MAKYIIDLNPDCVDGEFLKIPIRIAGENLWIKTKASLTPYTESDREAIENEVWEFVRCIMVMNANKYRECFDIDDITDDDFACKYTYQEAKKIYGEWKKEKNKIRVGDEVEIAGTIGIVTKVPYLDEERVHYIGKSGATYCNNAYAEIKKTGRHFDEIEELLKKMEKEE